MKLRAYTESQPFLGGTCALGTHIHGDLYTESFLCLELFTLVICISKKRNGIRQKNNALVAKCDFTTWQHTKHLMSFTIWDH